MSQQARDRGRSSRGRTTSSGKESDNVSTPRLLQRPHDKQEHSSRRKDAKQSTRTSEKERTPKDPSKGVVKLLDRDFSLEHLARGFNLEAQPLVVGVLGTQGCGKSTVLNILCQDQRFKAASKHQTLRMKHCTEGIDISYINPNLILVDSQPLLSPSLQDQLAKRDWQKVHSNVTTVGQAALVRDLQTILYMYSVCHVVILVQDWFPNVDFWRLIQTADSLRPALSSHTEHPPHTAQSVLLFNKAPREYFVQAAQQRYKDLIIRHLATPCKSLFFDLRSSKSSEYNWLHLLPDKDQDTQVAAYTGHPPFTSCSIEISHMITSIRPTTRSNFTCASVDEWIEVAIKQHKAITHSDDLNAYLSAVRKAKI